jgi:hypothetical protein
MIHFAQPCSYSSRFMPIFQHGKPVRSLPYQHGNGVT